MLHTCSGTAKVMRPSFAILARPGRSRMHAVASVAPGGEPVCLHRRAIKPTIRLSQRPARRQLNTQALFGFGTTATKSDSIYDFQVKDIDGKVIKLDKYKGQVALVVNLASQCGFTPQYAELQALYEKYNKRGFTVLGFPCNQFGQQEPSANPQIKRFAQSSYGAKFPLFSKVDVNGATADPVFDWLKTQKGSLFGNDIKWNFSKFLIDRNGKVVGRYASTTTPLSLEKEIEKLL